MYDATRTWLSVLDPGFAVHLVNGSSFGFICASQTLRRMRTRMRPVSLPVPRSAHLTGRDG